MIVHLTIHGKGLTVISWSHSIHSPHCNIVGYSWFTRHCVATNRRAQLYLHCAVITGIIGHNIVKDWGNILSVVEAEIEQRKLTSSTTHGYLLLTDP